MMTTETNPHTGHGSGRARKRESRKLAGSPVWAWLIFTFLFGLLTGGGVVGGIWYGKSTSEPRRDQTEVAASQPAPVAGQPARPAMPMFIPDGNPFGPQQNNGGGNAPFGPQAGLYLPVPEAKDANGWPRYVVSAEGFSIALPPEWRQLDLNPARMEANMQQMMKQNPQLNSLLGQSKEHLAALKFLGLDEKGAFKGYTPNLSVLCQQQPDWATLDLVAKETIGQLEKLETVVKPVVHEHIEKEGANHEKLRWKMALKNLFGQQQEVEIRQLIFQMNSTFIVVTMGCMAERADRYTATFETVERGFQLIAKADRD